MNRLRWATIQAYERLGWAGTLAIGLLLLATLFYTFAVHSLANEPNDRRQRGAEERQSHLQRLNLRFAEENRPAQQYAAFLDYFAGGNGLPESLMTIFNAAEDAGIALGQGDYEFIDAGAPLREFRVTLPVSGSYAAIRRFVSTILDDVPTAALEQIRFQRRQAGDPAVQAEIHFSIYVRAEG